MTTTTNKRWTTAATRRLPVWVGPLLLRLGVAVTCYLLVMITALAVIPLLGVFVHEQTGAHRLPPQGQLTVWLVPFVFVTVMLTVAELAFMRWLWHATNKRVGRRGSASGTRTPVGRLGRAE